MDRETFELVMILGVCLAGSYLVMRKFRAYVNAVLTRASDESWSDLWTRARTEHSLNNNAELEMFGSRLATIAGQLVVLLITAAIAWLLTVAPYAALLLAAYLGWGLYATRRLGFTANAVYARLLKRDRITYRLLHAALWPIHLKRFKRQPGNP